MTTTNLSTTLRALATAIDCEHADDQLKAMRAARRAALACHGSERRAARAAVDAVVVFLLGRLPLDTNTWSAK